jgi:hypothetical protein
MLVALAALALLVAGAPWGSVAHADPTLLISPPNATVPPLGTQIFTASGGSGTGYQWSLALNPSGGNITASGLYTAGATPNVFDKVQVTDSDLNVATVLVSVAAGVTITPPGITLSPGETQAFTAGGGMPPYTWTLLADGSGAGASVSATACGLDGGALGGCALYTAGGNVGMDSIQVTDSVGNQQTADIDVVASVPIGTTCTTSETCPANGSGNRYCVDGVCCSTACTGQCQACNTAGALGTCVTIAGPPVGTRPACPVGDSSKVCTSKTCDGKDPNACDVFVGPSVTCGKASCVDLIGTPGAVCQGDGGCEPVVPASCGTFACVSEACATSCTDTSECAPGNYCNVTTGQCLNPQADGGVGTGATSIKPASSGCAVGGGPSETFAAAALAALLGVVVRRRTRRATRAR